MIWLGVHRLSFTHAPLISALSCIGILSLAALSPLHLHQPIYSHPLPVRLALTHGQVCPCVASPSFKMHCQRRISLHQHNKVPHRSLSPVIIKVKATPPTKKKGKYVGMKRLESKKPTSLPKWECILNRSDLALPLSLEPTPLLNPLMMSASNWQESFYSSSDWSWQVNLVSLCVFVYRCGFECEKNRQRAWEIKKKKSKGGSDLLCLSLFSFMFMCAHTGGAGRLGVCMSNCDTSPGEKLRGSARAAQTCWQTLENINTRN